MKFRPFHDWIVVKLDKLPEKIGSIFVDGSAAERMRTATVISTGPGVYLKIGINRRPVAVLPGEKVAFFREHLEHKQGKQIVRTLLSELGDDIGLIREPDVLYAWTLTPREVPVDVLLTGHRGRTRQVWEEETDPELTALFNGLPPLYRADFLRDWQKGESRKLLLDAYAAKAVKDVPYEASSLISLGTK